MKHRNTNTDDLAAGELSHTLGVSPFVVPDGYFQQLENSITNRIHQNDSLNQLISKNEGFTTPANYFIEAEDAIFAAIRTQSLRERVTDDGFQIPENYFTASSESIYLQINEDKIKQLVAEDGFTHPSKDYFTQLENKVFAQTIQSVQEDTTPIRSLKKSSTSWFKYSIAAAALLFGVGTYIGLQQSTEQQAPEVAATISLQKVSDEEIVNYLAQVSNSDELMQLSQIVQESKDEPIKKLETDIDNEDIEEYLNYML